MDEKIFYQWLLEDILKYYADIEDCVIHAKERHGEWEDPTYDKAKTLTELSQLLHDIK